MSTPASDQGSIEAAPPVRSARPRRRVVVLTGVVIGCVMLLLTPLYLFGGMSGSALDPDMDQRYRDMVAAGAVVPIEDRFVIPIPGCTCHSDDPYLTQQHRNRRISECAGCHARQ